MPCFIFVVNTEYTCISGTINFIALNYAIGSKIAEVVSPFADRGDAVLGIGLQEAEAKQTKDNGSR
jgi:hypothetical protein